MTAHKEAHAIACYEPSGKFTATGVVSGFVFGAISGGIAGIAYAYASYYNPFVYINFLLTCLFALVVYKGVERGITYGKVRSPRTAALAGVAAALVGLYVAWVFWIQILYGTGPQGQHMWAINPVTLAESIGLVAANGVWSIFGATPTGIALLLIWLLEAAVIVGGTALLCAGAAGRPFCETCDCWAESQIEDFQLQNPPNLKELESELKHGNIATLMGCQRIDLDKLDVSSPVSFLNLSVLSCPVCEDVGFLTVESIGLSPPKKKKGELEKSSSTVASHLQLVGERFHELRDMAAVIAAEAASVGVAESQPNPALAGQSSAALSVPDAEHHSDD